MSDADQARRLTRADHAWLRMDSPTNRMVILGLWLLEPALPLAALKQRLAERLQLYPRFRQIAQADGDGARWCDDPHFAWSRHVHLRRARPAELLTRPALQAWCAELASQPLPPDRPPWQMHLLPVYGQGSALVLRIHHALADGVALVQVMQSLCDPAEAPVSRPLRPQQGADPAAALRPTARPHPPHVDAGDDRAEEAAWLAQVLGRPVAALAASAARAWAGSAGSRARWPQPEAAASAATAPDAAAQGLRLLADAAALATMADDSPTGLKRRLVGRKHLAWSEPVALAPLKAVAQALGCSSHELMLAAVTGALGHWLRAQGEPVAAQELRAMVPVNLRPRAQAWRLGNRFGLAPLLLPVGMVAPLPRLYALRARMQALKHSQQPLLGYALLAAAGSAPPAVQDALLGLFARKTTAVATWVPGPRQPLRLCGTTVTQAMFWVPAAGDVGVGLSMLSYAQRLHIGLITDAAVCAQPQAIVDRIASEIAQFECLALMLPWGMADAEHQATHRPAAALLRGLRASPGIQRTGQPDS